MIDERKRIEKIFEPRFDQIENYIKILQKKTQYEQVHFFKFMNSEIINNNNAVEKING